MLRFLDYSIRKPFYISLTKETVETYRCSCTLCDKCWFRPDIMGCIYGGPFSGYEEAGGEPCTDQVSERVSSP